MRIQIEDSKAEEIRTFKNGKAKRNGDHGRFKFGHKPFVSWDGEGYSVYVVSPNGDAVRSHRYCLFGNSRDDYVTGTDLSTYECLHLLLESRDKHPGCANVSFSFEYDVNMILRDLPRWALKRLKQTSVVKWHGFRIEHKPKKWFQVSVRGRDDGRASVRAIRVEDVFSFFSTSFVGALMEYIPTNTDIDTIKAGKDRRSQFGYHEMPFILQYWRMEHTAMVDLMETFRRILYSAEIRITSWYGPGAIASYFFKKYGTMGVLNRSDNPQLEMASRMAYAGGRFELLRCGLYEHSVYSYDINSAYPYAIAQLPDMGTGTWVHSTDAYEIRQAVQSVRLGYVKLKWHPNGRWAEEAIYNAMPMPLFNRSPLGNVSYPVVGEGWYQFNEAAWVLAQEPGFRTIEEAWIYQDDGSFPFEWVADLYETRHRWKRELNPAQLGLKLGLNSLYGKMAQRIGWDREKGLPPTWHQLDWAGFITSMCRSMLYPMMVEAYESDSLISVETDGIYTTQPIASLHSSEQIGTGLGQWEHVEYSGMLAVQSGMYWLRKGTTWQQPKSRGIPRERLDFERARRALRADIDRGIIKGSHNTFIGYGKALSASSQWGNWRTWQDSNREYAIGGDGKRIHDPRRCGPCIEGIGFDEGLHTLRIGVIDGGESHPHYLPWRDPGNNQDSDYHQSYDEERTWGIRV
jgi:hypothetical protein